MMIELNPEMEAQIRIRVREGAYESVDQFVQEAVHRLCEQEAWFAANAESIRQEIEEGWEQARRGELHSETEVRSYMEKMKTDWTARRAL